MARIAATASNRQDRNNLILGYHIRAIPPGGLHCPLCGDWSPLDLRPTLGVHLVCQNCGTIAVLPRAPLARAIKIRNSAFGIAEAVAARHPLVARHRVIDAAGYQFDDPQDYADAAHYRIGDPGETRNAND